MSRVITLRLSDRCTADEDLKDPDYQLHGVRVELDGDALSVDGTVVLVRVEPHGLGDVHWQVFGSSDAPRYTHVEIDT